MSIKSLSVLALLLTSIAGWSAPMVLRTAAQEGSAPKFIETPGGVTGHCPDIFHAIEKIDPQLRFQTDPTPTPIKRLEDALKGARLDVICAFFESPTRNEIAHKVSTPIFHVQERLVARSDDSAEIRNFRELAESGGTVVTQSGASYAEMLRGHGVSVYETSGGAAVAMRAVADKRMRFFYINELTAAYFIQSGGWRGQLRILPTDFRKSPSYIWVSRKLDKELVQRLENAVTQLQKSGELDRIYRSHQLK